MVSTQAKEFSLEAVAPGKVAGPEAYEYVGKQVGHDVDAAPAKNGIDGATEAAGIEEFED